MGVNNLKNRKNAISDCNDIYNDIERVMENFNAGINKEKKMEMYAVLMASVSTLAVFVKLLIQDSINKSNN